MWFRWFSGILMNEPNMDKEIEREMRSGQASAGCARVSRSASTSDGEDQWRRKARSSWETVAKIYALCTFQKRERLSSLSRSLSAFPGWWIGPIGSQTTRGCLSGSKIFSTCQLPIGLNPSDSCMDFHVSTQSKSRWCRISFPSTHH